jgi:hypothetical protein
MDFVVNRKFKVIGSVLLMILLLNESLQKFSLLVILIGLIYGFVESCKECPWGPRRKRKNVRSLLEESVSLSIRITMDSVSG